MFIVFPDFPTPLFADEEVPSHPRLDIPITHPPQHRRKQVQEFVELQPMVVILIELSEKRVQQTFVVQRGQSHVVVEHLDQLAKFTRSLGTVPCQTRLFSPYHYFFLPYSLNHRCACFVVACALLRICCTCINCSRVGLRCHSCCCVVLLPLRPSVLAPFRLDDVHAHPPHTAATPDSDGAPCSYALHGMTSCTSLFRFLCACAAANILNWNFQLLGVNRTGVTITSAFTE